jgi:hypothetical protein
MSGKATLHPSGKRMLQAAGESSLDCPCCEETEKCGTIIWDESCGPYQGFLLYALPCGGGAPVLFYGNPEDWEMVSCACDESRKFVDSYYVINGSCYHFVSIAAFAHYPGDWGIGCTDIDTTGATLITSFECDAHGCVETLFEGTAYFFDLPVGDTVPTAGKYYSIPGLGCVLVGGTNIYTPCTEGTSFGTWAPSAGPFNTSSCT